MRQVDRNSDGTRSLLATLGLAAGMVFVVWALQGQFSRRVAEHWREQLELADDDQSERLARRIARNGASGIPSLVDALGSERPSIAAASKRVLSEQIDRWQLFDEYDADENLNILAESLSDAMGQFGPTARANAADLATRILLVPESGLPKSSNPAARTRRITLCEEVLQGSTTENRLAAKTRFLGQPIVAASDDHLASIPHPPPVAVALPQSEETPTVDARSDVVNVVDIVELHSSVSSEPGIETSKTMQPAMWNEPSDAATNDLEPPNAPLPHDWSRMESDDLMRYLRSDELSIQTAVREELLGRGFRQVHIDMARRLYDPDPEARKRLARLLPDLQSIDPMPWLIRLAEDEDVEVRQVAIGLLATTNDTQVLDRLEQLTEQDSDLRIRRQGEQIAQRRREANR